MYKALGIIAVLLIGYVNLKNEPSYSAVKELNFLDNSFSLIENAKPKMAKFWKLRYQGIDQELVISIPDPDTSSDAITKFLVDFFASKKFTFSNVDRRYFGKMGNKRIFLTVNNHLEDKISVIFLAEKFSIELTQDKRDEVFLAIEELAF